MGDVVAFRRVRGRIIPIKERKKKAASGAGLTVTGLGVGAVSGDMAASATKKVAKFKFLAQGYAQKAEKVFRAEKFGRTNRQKWEKGGQMAFDFGNVGNKSESAFYQKTAMRKALKSKGFKYLNKGLKAGGIALSAGLIGHGVKNLYEGVRGRKATGTEETISNMAGAGSAFAFHSAFGRKMGVKHYFKYGLNAAKKVVK